MSRMNHLSHIAQQRNMPFLRRGLLVVDHKGRQGSVVGGSASGYVRIRLDGEKKAGLYHPQWQLQYTDPDGNIVANYKTEEA